MLKRSLVLALLVSLLGFTSATVASADPGDANYLNRGSADTSVLALITDDDLFSVADLSIVLATPLAFGSTGGTQHYGPYASTSPDSGTCGNDWAQDSFERHFTVRANGAGSYTVVEQFKRGSFTTFDGVSPGSCDFDDTPAGTIRSGVLGDMHGYEVIAVTGAQISSDPGCGVPSPDCTTTDFITSHFSGTFTVPTYFFHYSAGDQGLLVHEWKNASDDRGGNHGDIQDQQLP